MNLHFHNSKQLGMTLVEMVVVIGIYTILSLAITTSITNLYKNNSYAIEQSEEVDNARKGITQWNRDVKEMTTAEDGTFPLVVIDENHLGYFSDTDQDANVEYVEYILSTTTLKKFTYNPTGSPAVYNFSSPDSEEILSEYVRNISQSVPTFTYFDNSGNQLNSASPILDVRYIKAQIIVNIDPVRSPGEFMLMSSVAPRNLKDNL
ncbi:type II secretion system protein [Candidatus Nomurabacteria bacterium]|nr:type II secretion system protein [Candidatus Kaiserbacteria bacterium]MCB9814598.1 type II secretion system protein [Candidatus Nomurabacteria bacterium]